VEGSTYSITIVIEDEYKSTQFQFGSILGLGVKHKQFEISYRYLHISNAGIEMPNPGTDFHSLAYCVFILKEVFYVI